MDTREVYRGAKSDYYTHCHDLPPQIGGCRVEAEGVPYKDEIDGNDGALKNIHTHNRTVTIVRFSTMWSQGYGWGGGGGYLVPCR